MTFLLLVGILHLTECCPTVVQMGVMVSLVTRAALLPSSLAYTYYITLFTNCLGCLHFWPALSPTVLLQSILLTERILYIKDPGTVPFQNMTELHCFYGFQASWLTPLVCYLLLVMSASPLRHFSTCLSAHAAQRAMYTILYKECYVSTCLGVCMSKDRSSSCRYTLHPDGDPGHGLRLWSPMTFYLLYIISKS